MDKIMIEKARSHFMRASEEFGFTFISPYLLDEENGITAFGYISGYGSYYGVVLNLIEPPNYEINKEIAAICDKKHMWYTFLNVELLVGEYNSYYFQDLLEDWRTFSHCDTNDRYVSLHDCKSKRAYFEYGVLGFEFIDGFWITPEHPESHLDTLVKTDFSRVEYELLDGDEYDVNVFVFEKNILGQTVKKEWSVQKLVDSINNEEVVVEFLYQYVDGMSRIVECWLWSDRKPYSRECVLKISAREVQYHWNRILEDRVW
ncbi:MAG: hypothetical protein IIX44_05305 [Clostridia bacterium]|nr:hypothetical protein [Clostridia bacterium]